MMTNRESRLAWLLAIVTLSLGSLLGCSGSQGAPGPAGAAPDGGGCTITNNADGTATVTCSDGTSATISGGLDGGAGTGCTAAQTDAGIVVTCGDASTLLPSGTPGEAGKPGQPATQPGQTPGLVAKVAASAPPNGKDFATGDKIVYTATLTNAAGAPVTLDYFKTANLYMNGPRDVLKDKTAVKLLGASTDRSKKPHHYIDLKTSTAPNLVVAGNKITYTMNAVSDEDPGTYTIGLYLVPKDYVFDQTFQLTDVQIKTATVEPLLVGGAGSCTDCHKGGANGKIYMHHIIPGYSPTGSPALDSVPVQTCLMCHNQAGYSAIQVCADGTKAGHGGVCADGSTPTYMPDPIVRRVHGVHMGENLLSKLDTAAGTGDFEAFTGVVFPAGIKDCTKCHKNDAWKTHASREACGACHDQVDFKTGNFVPPRPTTVACTTDANCSSLSTFESPKCNTTSGFCELTKHGGGAQADDTQCMSCHGAGKLAPIETVHKIAPEPFQYTVGLALSAPANGKDYEGSEAPVLTITVKNAGTGTIVSPSTFTEAKADTADLFVSGPRMDTGPVLTTAAANPDPNGYYVANDLRVRTSSANEDPKLTRSATTFSYQLGPVTGLDPGTYTVFFKVGNKVPVSWAVKNFQVGTATTEPMVATNCTKCHANTRMHDDDFAASFNPDICKSCHDYQNQNAKKTLGWGEDNFNYGFGAAPLKRRIHGVHFGHYLNYPEQIQGAETATQYGNVIFPQDVRNCQTCHSTIDSWKEEPSRLACLACHDSDADQAHGALMTVDPTPKAPYSGDEVESCESCHGAGRQFSIGNVHNITDPYVPPYPRNADPGSF